MANNKEEDWLVNARALAKEEAVDFVEYLKHLADVNDLEEEWFIKEVVKNINALNNE